MGGSSPTSRDHGRSDGGLLAREARVEDGFAVVTGCAAMPRVLRGRFRKGPDARRAAVLAIKEAAAAQDRRVPGFTVYQAVLAGRGGKPRGARPLGRQPRRRAQRPRRLT